MRIIYIGEKTIMEEKMMGMPKRTRGMECPRPHVVFASNNDSPHWKDASPANEPSRPTSTPMPLRIKVVLPPDLSDRAVLLLHHHHY